MRSWPQRWPQGGGGLRSAWAPRRRRRPASSGEATPDHDVVLEALHLDPVQEEGLRHYRDAFPFDGRLGFAAAEDLRCDEDAGLVREPFLQDAGMHLAPAFDQA